MSNGVPKDPDDFFAETRMSFGDHIEELRTHLWRAIYGFGVAMFFSLFIGHIIVRLITAPVKQQLEKFYERRANRIRREQGEDPTLARINQPTPFRRMWVPRKQLVDLLKGGSGRMDEQPKLVDKEEMVKAENAEAAPWYRRAWNWLGDSGDQGADPDAAKGVYKIPREEKEKHLVALWFSWESPLNVAGDLQPAERQYLDTDNPATLNVQEAFMVWFKVCMVTGVVIGSPWIFWQIWMFVAAGLYPSEKRLVHVYLPVSVFLFVVGVVVCEWLVIPRAIEALLWFNEWMGLKPDMRLNEWMGFAIFMPVIFGLSFQTPLVMLFLHRLGIMDAASFAGKRSYAWFAMAVFAALVTPSTDALSMLFLWVPMSLLFELGIILIRLTPHEPSMEEDASETGELVEV
jgi:sec-independent protein translocase protein TatC